MEPKVARGRAQARAALAGNPSDGFGGAVLALTVDEFAAEVVAEAGPDDETPAGGEGALAAAALARLRHAHQAPSGGVRLRCQTSVPERVGLGGSSAIAIATLRALCALESLPLSADEIARIALEAETEELGIAAGPQDRYVQAHEGLVLMDFGGAPTVSRLDRALLPPLFLAYRADAAESSGVPHADLRSRAVTDRAVTDAMRELAALAHRAAEALTVGDTAGIAASMDSTFDLRRQIMALDPRHERMVEIAREHGAAANYAGSGGAIVGIRPASWDVLRAALEAEGCAVLEPRPSWPRAARGSASAA